MKRLNWASLAVIGIIILMLIGFGGMAIGGQGSGGYGMMGPGMMGDYGGSFLGWLIPIGFLLLIGVGFVWFIQSRSYPESSDSDDPIEILKRRYARGEISKEEFEKIKSDL